MRAERITDLVEFLSVSEPWRAANPLTTNIISTIAINATSGARFVEHIEAWVIRGDDDAVLGAGMRADPYEFNVGPMPVSAARLLGAEMAGMGARPTEARGVEQVVRAFADALCEASAGTVSASSGTEGEGLYELGDLKMQDADGAVRQASDDDLPLVTRWIVEFAHDAGVSSHEPERRARSYIARGSMLLWEADGQPVAMAGQAPIVTTGDVTVGRVGPVFTPPQHRRRGYGAAVTAAAAMAIREAGARVMLFTDLANPTSNAIYQRLGFRLVETIRHIEFS